MTMREINGYYYIEYSFTDEYGEYSQESVCDYLYSDPTMLSNIASAYVTDKCHGWLSVDADTLLPVGFGFEYSGRHTINGLDYTVAHTVHASFDTASTSAYTNLTGEMPEDAKP